MKTIVGLFQTYTDADAAVMQLEEAGYNHENIHMIAPDKVIREYQESGVAEGAGAGATLGGLAGLLLSLTSLAIPGIGPVVATVGVLSSTAIGAGVGAAAGGLIGALVDIGVPEEEAPLYVEGVRRGYILLAVKAATKRGALEAKGIMTEQGALEIEEQGVRV